MPTHYRSAETQRAPEGARCADLQSRSRRLPGVSEEVDHAQHDALRLAADVDRVRVDVPRVRRSTVVPHFRVPGVDLRALAERVCVAYFIVVGTRVRAPRESADARALGRTALAVVRAL